MLDVSLELKGKTGEVGPNYTLASCLRRCVLYLSLIQLVNCRCLGLRSLRSSVHTIASNAARPRL